MPQQRSASIPVAILVLQLLAAVSFPAPEAGAAQELARLSTYQHLVEWQPLAYHDSFLLRVVGPPGEVKQFEFAGRAPMLSVEDPAGWPDGVYVYELIATPQIDEATRKELSAARERGDEEAVASIQRAVPEPQVQSGTFRIVAGVVVAGEPESGIDRLSTPSVHALPAPDQQIGDDLIVTGSVCAGAACVNGEAFGDDALRLKQFVMRLHFEDTSTGAGFPANDWRILANDAGSGGADRFSIDDVTNGRTPFTLLANAPTDSLFVATSGNVGLRTATPATELHLSTGNTPEVRLEQNASGGLTPQTWDVAGNETGFFVRDVTNGAKVPLRIAPNAPTSSVEVTAAGDVAFGTSAPAAPFHVKRTTASNLLMQLERNGDLFFRLKNNVTGQFADMNLVADSFRINFGLGDPGPELMLLNTGDLIISGGCATCTPDYVFDPSYALMPLEELADFVARERHLPNVPNAAEIKEQGLNVSVFPMRLLEKIEELTLYAIDQHERIGAQQEQIAEIETLRAENASLEARIAALEQLLLEPAGE